MATYNNWDSLVSAAQDKCNKVLERDVAPVAKEIVKKHIEKDIYGVYTPSPGAWVGGSTYKRRHVLESSLYHEFVRSDTIIITSNATASKSIIKGYSFRNRHPGSFFKLLESGNMGIWKKGFPRPAISESQKEIDKSAKIQKAIRDGLRIEFGI